MIEPINVSTLGLVRSELLKLRGSLVIWLSLAVPAMVLLLMFLATLTQATSGQMYMLGSAAFFGYAMLPLGIMALTVVLAQIEHSARGWDPLLSLPGARSRIFIIKLVAAAIVVGLWTLMLGVGAIVIAQFFAETMPDQIAGALPTDMFIEVLARMWAASLFMLVIQYGLALYFRSFVPPLLIGVGGIIFSVGATSSKWGIYFPWLLSTNQLASDQANGDFALWFGVGGAVVAAIILQLLMARREW